MTRLLDRLCLLITVTLNWTVVSQTFERIKLQTYKATRKSPMKRNQQIFYVGKLWRITSIILLNVLLHQSGLRFRKCGWAKHGTIFWNFVKFDGYFPVLLEWKASAYITGLKLKSHEVNCFDWTVLAKTGCRHNLRTGLDKRSYIYWPWVIVPLCHVW